MLALATALAFSEGGHDRSRTGESRPRGELADCDKATIEIFNRTSPSEVYISPKTAYADFSAPARCTRAPGRGLWRTGMATS
jgi:hypothetical protein